MKIKNKTLIAVIHEVQFFSIEEVCRKLETPRAALDMLNKGKELPKTFLETAKQDLDQVFFLLEGAEQMSEKGLGDV